jgi:hypothetical protein
MIITDWFIGSDKNYEKLKTYFLKQRVIEYGVVTKGWNGEI